MLLFCSFLHYSCHVLAFSTTKSLLFVTCLFINSFLPPFIYVVPPFYPHIPPSAYHPFHSLLFYILLYFIQAPVPHHISLPRQCCQQLEHITANCATCGCLKGLKREGEGTAQCQWRWDGLEFYVVGRRNALQLSGYSHKALCLITNKHQFNQGPECCRLDTLYLSSSMWGVWTQ